MKASSLRDLLLAQVFAVGAGLVVTFATARFLGPAGRGDLAFITATGSLLAVVGFGSLHIGVTKAHSAGAADALHRGLILGTRAAGGVLLVGLVATLVLRAVDPTSVRIGALALAAVGGALSTLSLVVLRIRQGVGDARQFRTAWAIQSGVYAAAGIPVAVVTGSAAAVAVCWMTGIALSTAYGLRGYERPPAGPPQPTSTRRIIGDSLSSHVGFMGNQVLFRADVVILGLVVPSAALGIYSVAAPLAEMTWVVAEASSLAAFSNVAMRRGDGGTAHLVKLNLAVGVVGGLLILGLAALLLPRVLPEYTAAVGLIALLLPGVVAQGCSRVAFSALVGRDDRRPAVLLGLLSVGLSIAYLPGALIWGITGAAVTSSVIYVIQAAAVLLVSRRAGVLASER